jgi:hypothetical protein
MNVWRGFGGVKPLASNSVKVSKTGKVITHISLDQYNGTTASYTATPRPPRSGSCRSAVFAAEGASSGLLPHREQPQRAAPSERRGRIRIVAWASDQVGESAPSA